MLAQSKGELDSENHESSLSPIFSFFLSSFSMSVRNNRVVTAQTNVNNNKGEKKSSALPISVAVTQHGDVVQSP